MDTASVLSEMERLADYLSPTDSDWVKKGCRSVPTHLFLNYVVFVYNDLLPPYIKAEMDPAVSYTLQMEYKRMKNQESSLSSESSMLGHSSLGSFPVYSETLLSKLQAYVTETYLQTAYLPNPSYAFHDEGHSRRIVNYIDQLASLHHSPHRLNSVERFLVMAGAWTHDIGFAQSSLRGVHHKQSREIIFKDSSIRAYLDNNETVIEVVARLAYNHSSRVDVVSIEDWRPTIELVPGQAQKARVRHLSCILRLADALDINHQRAIHNKVLLEKLESDNPVSYAYHLCHLRVQFVRVNPKTGQIDIQALVKTKVDEDRIRRFINQRLKLRHEVRTLVPYLWPCIPDLKDELNLDVQLTSQAPALPASIVTDEFLSGES